jgi:hypothetical protein
VQVEPSVDLVVLQSNSPRLTLAFNASTPPTAATIPTAVRNNFAFSIIKMLLNQKKMTALLETYFSCINQKIIR